MVSAIQWFEFLFLPPGLLLPFALAGMFLLKRRKHLGLFIIFLGIALTLGLSMPKVARSLVTGLQIHPPIDMQMNYNPQTTAIVVLGGGRYPNAPEYNDQDQVSPATLERLRYAARLKQKLDLPMVLSGGRRNADSTPEAVMMNQVMVDEYAVEPEFLDVRSANTHEQAIYVQAILAEQAIEQVIIVTHAWHMIRAMSEFRAQGISAIPAPMGFMATAEHQVDYIPSAAAMLISSRALHEHYALTWLNLHHQHDQTLPAKAAEPAENSPQDQGQEPATP
jgi:uncharacterized SAM-binding protein YcdF (DUF218 family)